MAQFLKGRWTRYADPEWGTLLTGRSSLLDEHGKIAETLATVDPTLAMSAEDWLGAARNGVVWRFSGDGILAEYSVHANPERPGSTPSYDMSLKFQLLAVQRRIAADNHAREMRDGDAKGGNSTAEYEKTKARRLETLKLLEANALKRGDRVLAPH